MIEQNSAPKKQKVGSLFFHLFNRLSLWLYTLLIGSLPGRLVTSYDVLEQRWSEICTRIFGARDGKLYRNLHKLRLKCARLIEHSIILRVLDKFVRFLLICPLNAYGIFFFTYGAVSAAVHFVAERLAVGYEGDIGWGIAGCVIAVASLPLLGSSKPLSRAALGSRIIGKILRTDFGFELSQKDEEQSVGNTVMAYLATVLGVSAGMLTFFFHPVTLPLIILILALTVMVFYRPEAGVLLAAGTVCIWWTTGTPELCAVIISGVTLISYLMKLIKGKRVLHVRLLDFTVLLLVLVFALHGMLIHNGITSILYGFGYALLVAMYFPVVNLIRSREWLQRCYKYLIFSGVVLAITGVVPIAQLLYFLDMTIARVDLSMMESLFARYETYFGQGTVVGGMLILMLPLILTVFMGKNSLTGLFWKLLWILAAFASVFFTMQISVWIGFGVALLTFVFIYSYRSMSATMLLAFPVACGAVWSKELYGGLGIREWNVYHDVLQTVVAYADGADNRKAIAQSVLKMAKDHPLGVGLGVDAVHSVFPYYAESASKNAVDFQSMYLQLVAECGYLGLLLLLAVLVLFLLCVFTYLRWGGHPMTKARVGAGVSGIIGVMVMGLSCNLLNNASLFGMIWLVIGLTVASLRTQYDMHARAVHTHSSTTERSDIAFRTK